MAPINFLNVSLIFLIFSCVTIKIQSEEIKFKPNEILSDNIKVSELKHDITSGNEDKVSIDTDHRQGTNMSNVRHEEDQIQTSDNMTMEKLLSNLDLLIDMDPSLNRTKRQSLAGLNLASLISNPPQSQANGNPNSVESLLASCQLTNLLMYQLLQQKQQQASPLISPAGLIPSFPVPGAVNQNLIIPQAETLSTYFSTTTFLTTMTTTGLVTIPLFFGNKPSTTTITRTKTYEMTTSSVKTLTATIRPTYTQLPASALMSTVDLTPTPATLFEGESSLLTTLGLGDQESSSNLKKNRFLESEETSPVKTKQATPELVTISGNKRVNDDTTSQKTGRNSRGGKRRKNTNSRPSNTIANDNLHSNIVAVKKNAENIERSRGREPAQYKILRDNRERQPVTLAPVTRENSYQPQNPFGYEERDRTVAYNNNNNRYNNNPTENYTPTSAPSARGANRGRNTYAAIQQQQREDILYQQRPVEVQPDPEYVQYPDDYGYYARRLKRGQQKEQRDAYSGDSEEYPLEREYLLEPSFQGDFSQGFEQVQKCPPVPAELSAKTVTITSTEIRTITKLVNPSSSVPRGSSRTLPQSSSNDRFRGTSRAVTESPATPATSNNNGDSRSRGRSRSRSRSTTTTTAPTRRDPNSSSEVSSEAYTGRRFRPRSRNYDYERGGR